ncbi:MAG TPA: hypothetical protein VEA41_14200 [Salinarimonas sp.]|jgi:hypothetical protein|nr:hypothetical protein [Salinarimonas sp.]
MSKFTLISTAAVLAIGAAFTAAPAQAQVGFEVGPGGVRLGVRDDRPYQQVIERRNQRRVIVEDDEEECRVEVRRRVNQFGEVTTRRVRICE